MQFSLITGLQEQALGDGGSGRKVKERPAGLGRTSVPGDLRPASATRIWDPDLGPTPSPICQVMAMCRERERIWLCWEGLAH